MCWCMYILLTAATFQVEEWRLLAARDAAKPAVEEVSIKHNADILENLICLAYRHARQYTRRGVEKRFAELHELIVTMTVVELFHLFSKPIKSS